MYDLRQHQWKRNYKKAYKGWFSVVHFVADCGVGGVIRRSDIEMCTTCDNGNEIMKSLKGVIVAVSGVVCRSDIEMCTTCDNGNEIMKSLKGVIVAVGGVVRRSNIVKWNR